jgi:hypothetical protein
MVVTIVMCIGVKHIAVENKGAMHTLGYIMEPNQRIAKATTPAPSIEYLDMNPAPTIAITSNRA